jgi:hypothetical protein
MHPLLVLDFFPHLNMQKTCLLWAPTTLNTHHLSVIFSYLTMNHIVKNLVFIVKKPTKFDQKTVSLLCVKTKGGAHKQPT